MTEKETWGLRETQLAQNERAQHWGRYFRNLVRHWQFADESGGRILMNKSLLSDLVKVSDMTIAQWLEGKKYPSRENCGRVANAFHVPMTEAMLNAGYNPYQDDSYNTVNDIMHIVEQEKGFSEDERKRLYDALVITITPDWITNNPDWIELIRVVFNQGLSPLAKAHRIASIVDAWQQESFKN